MKKIISVFLTLCILLTFSQFAFASGSYPYSDADITYVVSDVDSNNRVTVDVYFDNCIGMTSGSIDFVYDEDHVTMDWDDYGKDSSAISCRPNQNSFFYLFNPRSSYGNAEAGFYFFDYLWTSEDWAACQRTDAVVNGEHFNGFSFTLTLADLSAKISVTAFAKIKYLSSSEDFYYSSIIDIVPDGFCAHEDAELIETLSFPTCTEKGSGVYYCPDCESEFEDEIEELGHDLWYAGEKATCTADGYEGCYCDRCSYTDMTVLPATGHSYEFFTRYPTCTRGGYVTYRCSDCGYLEDEPLDPTGHTDADNDGYCDVCGLVPAEKCTHICHKGGFLGTLWKIINFFNRLFMINPECKCGEFHYYSK